MTRVFHQRWPGDLSLLAVLALFLLLPHAGALAGGSAKVPPVAIIKDNAALCKSLSLVMRGLDTSATNAFHTAKEPVTSLQQGLTIIQSVSDRPVVAACECDGWFWYGTEVLAAAGAKASVRFQSGYAIKKNHQFIFRWPSPRPAASR